MNTKLSIFVVLLLATSGALAAESFEALRDRLKFQKMTTAIKNGDRNGLAPLPAKGYSDGLSGLMKKYDVYPNPAYSFASCGPTDKITANGGVPGCVVSIKLARKLPNGDFRDLGVRIEYAIGPGERQFVANNSVYAQHAISGNGWLDAQLIE